MLGKSIFASVGLVQKEAGRILLGLQHIEAEVGGVPCEAGSLRSGDWLRVDGAVGLAFMMSSRVGVSVLRARRPDKHHLKGAKLKQLQKALQYLKNNRRYMHYDQSLAAGYPIASEVAEGACRHLVKDRMELTGMRWCIDGAQAMLDVRAMYLGDDWLEFKEYRFSEDTERLYPYRDAAERCWSIAA